MLLLFLSVQLYAQKSAIFYKIEVYKISQSGKKFEVVALDINAKGSIRNRNKTVGVIKDLKSFDESIQDLFSSEEKIVEIKHGADGKGIQDISNGQNIYITVTFLSDYLSENESEHATHYRYRETKLAVGEKEYAFFKYFNDEHVLLLKKALQ